MGKKTTKKALIIILMVSVLIFITSGYFILQSIWNPSSSANFVNRDIPINENWITTNCDLETFISLAPENEMGSGEFQLGITGDIWDGDIHLETPQDTLYVNVANTTNGEMHLMLKVFYNYEEVAFEVVGVSRENRELLFVLEPDRSISIPVRLPEAIEASDTVSRLTIGVFDSPERAAASDDDLRFRPGMMLNYEINYGSRESMTLSLDHPTLMEESEFAGFSVHENSEPPGDGSIWVFAGDTHAVRAGEEVPLTFFANAEKGGGAIHDYLIVAMVDWRQIPMNEQPYLWIDIEDDVLELGQHIPFTFIAPEEPGFYEFVAFIASNPTEPATFEMFYPLHLVRFTLEVTE